MNIDHAKQIIENAPEGATHYTDLDQSLNIYAKLEPFAGFSHLGVFSYYTLSQWHAVDVFAGIKCLNDLQRMVKQIERIEHLEKAKEEADQRVIDAVSNARKAWAAQGCPEAKALHGAEAIRNAVAEYQDESQAIGRYVLVDDLIEYAEMLERQSNSQ